jgi:pilus assembly protein TadC
MMPILMALSLLALLLVSLTLLLRYLLLRDKIRSRWYQVTGTIANEPLRDIPSDSIGLSMRNGLLGRWLYRAGFRSASASTVFLTSTVFATALGLSGALAFVLSGRQTLAEDLIVRIPGGVGEAFLPMVWLAPWALMISLAGAPWLFVYRARCRRVELVEQDLPLALELLSTLSEAGLGFDTALSRILKTRLEGRPLAEDLRMFQADLLAGRTRIESLRRLSDRLDIPSVSIFVSTMVQAEQLGMGIARVLRQQADDVRARRRERAIAFANALPVKRVIPLAVCFLPGLFVWTLGPTFLQLLKMADAFLQMQNF